MRLWTWSLLLVLDCSGIVAGFATGHAFIALAFGIHGAAVAVSAPRIEGINDAA